MDPKAVGLTLIAFASFCLLSSAVYVINDIHDAPLDRLHPQKKNRPIAAGELRIWPALVFAVILGLAGLSLSWSVNQALFAIAAAYVLLQAAYTFVLKRMVILDVFAISAGFVLRVAAGAEAINVPVSSWLFICAILISLFLGLAKRRHEIVLLETAAQNHRSVLHEYSAYLLDQMIVVTVAATVVSYSLYTLSPETVHKFGTDHLKYTIPFVLFGLFRYLYLIQIRGEGGRPEKSLFDDWPLLCNGFLYALVVALVLYG